MRFFYTREYWKAYQAYRAHLGIFGLTPSCFGELWGGAGMVVLQHQVADSSREESEKKKKKTLGTSCSNSPSHEET